MNDATIEAPMVGGGRATSQVHQPPRLRPYQEPIAQAVVADLLAGKPEVLLAACPGFGKTETTIEILSRLMQFGHVARGLVLAHGTTVLRRNFGDRLRERRPDLLPVVRVALPQEWRTLRGNYPLVVVDEAHEFYEAGEGGMVDRVLKQVGAKQVLLLTGSPSRFIRRGVKPHIFALDDLFQVDGGKWVSDIRIDLALSSYRVREEDWDAKCGEVKNTVRYRKRQTDKTLADLLDSIGPKLRLGVLPSIVACRNIEMADQVSRFLWRRGLEHRVSHNRADPKSANVAAFRAGDVRLLVIVRRGQLGFDYPNLCNFIDLSGSRNPDRIFQMMCRLARPAAGKPEKHFVKVMPKAFSGEHLRLFMTGVAALKHRELYETWDGGSFYRLRAPVRAGGSAAVDAAGRPAVFERAMMLFGDGFEVVRDDSGRLATVRLGELVGVVHEVTITHRGRSMSGAAWARESGLKAETLISRWRDGVRGEALFALRNLQIRYRGRIYNAKELAAAVGLSHCCIFTRWKAGLRGRALVAPPNSGPNKIKVQHEGRMYNWAELAVETGVPAPTLAHRWRRGYRGDNLVARRLRHGAYPKPRPTLESDVLAAIAEGCGTVEAIRAKLAIGPKFVSRTVNALVQRGVLLRRPIRLGP